jgi:hypothetical protein
MQCRFSPLHVDEKNALTEEGRNLRAKYVKEGGLTGNFFTMLQPLLCVGIERSKCPKPLLPLLEDLIGKGFVVEVEEKKDKPVDNERELRDAVKKKSEIDRAKAESIEKELSRHHVIKPRDMGEIISGEMDAALDLHTLRNGHDVLSVIHDVSRELRCRAVLVCLGADGFKGIECSASNVNVVKIRLSTIVHHTAELYRFFNSIDEHIRNDKTRMDDDSLNETITITRSKKASVYMFANFYNKRNKFALSLVVPTDVKESKDGMVFMNGRKAVKMLNDIFD